MVSPNYVHLGNLIAMDLEPLRRSHRPLRVLDVGCGRASMLLYLDNRFNQDAQRIEIFGYEIEIFGGRNDDYLEVLHLKLAGCRYPCPANNFAVIQLNDPIPFADDFFDVIISNQVLEHVGNLEALTKEIARCLASDGVSYHIFPLRDSIFDFHLYMFFIHWIKDYGKRKIYTRLYNRIRLSRQKHDPEFVAMFFDNECNYIDKTELFNLFRRSGFHTDLTFTKEYVETKIIQVFGGGAERTYKTRGLWAWFTAEVLRYMTNITVRATKCSGRHDSSDVLGKK